VAKWEETDKGLVVTVMGKKPVLYAVPPGGSNAQ
jgi:hypothetical protein